VDKTGFQWIRDSEQAAGHVGPHAGGCSRVQFGQGRPWVAKHATSETIIGLGFSLFWRAEGVKGGVIRRARPILRWVRAQLEKAALHSADLASQRSAADGLDYKKNGFCAEWAGIHSCAKGGVWEHLLRLFLATSSPCFTPSVPPIFLSSQVLPSLGSGFAIGSADEWARGPEMRMRGAVRARPGGMKTVNGFRESFWETARKSVIAPSADKLKLLVAGGRMFPEVLGQGGRGPAPPSHHRTIGLILLDLPHGADLLSLNRR